MCSFVLNHKGQVISRSTVTPLNVDNINNDDIFRWKSLFMNSIENAIGDYTNHVVKGETLDSGNIYSSAICDLNDNDDIISSDCVFGHKDADEHGASDFDMCNDPVPDDKYIGMKVNLPKDGGFLEGKVISRKIDCNGKLIGESNSNPYMDTSIYEVEFPDGKVWEYSTNVIDENLYSIMDDNGSTPCLFSEIVDHSCDSNSIKINDGWFITDSGNKRRVITIKGWKFCVAWKDGNQSWIPLIEVKESNHVELAEYSIAKGIDQESAFSWWVKFTLKKRENIISKMKSVPREKGMKFGIEIPMSVKHAHELDNSLGTSHWKRAIEK